MANSKQAEKRARQNKARYKLRHSQRSQTRTAVKAVRYAIEENDAAKASDLLKKRKGPTEQEHTGTDSTSPTYFEVA